MARIWNRGKLVIGLPTNEYEDHRIQSLGHRRAVGAATIFHSMFYKETPELLCKLMPDIHVHDPRLRRSERSCDLAVKVPRSNLVSHARSFLPSTVQLWNSLPLDQGPSSAGRIIALWVLLRQQLHNVFFVLFFVSLFLSLLLMHSYTMT